MRPPTRARERYLTPRRLALGFAALGLLALTPLALFPRYGIGAMVAVVALGATLAWFVVRRSAPHHSEIRYFTERKRAERDLRASEERYALAMEAAGDGHTDWNLVSGEHYISPRLLEICGYEPGTTFIDRAEWVRRFPFHPDDRPKWERAVAEHLAGRESHFKMELRIVVHGEVRWTAFHFLSTRDAAGTPIRWTGSIGDITEHKRTEEALRQSQERYERVTLASNLGLWDYDAVKDEVFVSPRFLEMGGFAPHTVFAGYADFLRRVPLHPEDRERWKQATEELFARGGSRLAMELRAVVNGETRWRSLEGMCFRDATGRVVRWTGSTIDISDRKRAEEALRESRERYALAVAGSDDGLWDIDFTGRTIFVSPRARELAGLPPGPEAVPMDEYFAALPVHPDDAPGRAAAMRAHIAGETPAYVGEFRLRQLDGVYRWRRIHGLCVRDVNGNPTRMAGSVSDVDARRNAESALRLSEQRYSLAMEAAQDAHWDWIIGTDEYYTSPRVVDVFGLPPGTTFRSRQDYLTKTPLLQEDLQVWLRRARDLFAGSGSRLSMELRALINGEIHWIQHNGLCFRDSAGRAVRWCGSVRDVTERKRAEEALRLSEERYALAMQASEEGHFDWDVPSDGIFASAHLKKVLALPADIEYRTRDEMVSRIPFHPGDGEQVRQMTRTMLAGSALDHEFEYRLSRGPFRETRWIRARWKIFRDVHGMAKRVIGVVSDITERKLAAEALRLSEEDLRSRQEMLELAQKSARAIAYEWRFGKGEPKNQWSPDIEAMYGLAPGSYDGTYVTWKKLVHPQDWPVVKRVIRHAWRTGDIEAEYRVVYPDGSVHWLQSRGRLFFTEQRRPARLVGFMQDISQRKRAEEELRKMEQELRRAQRLEAVGTLAGGIAHDFNNILGAIMGYAEMATREARKDTRLRRDVDAILAAGERGRALVDRILAFSRSGLGERDAVHVEAVVREALDQIAAKLPENVTLAPRLRAGRAAMLGDSTQVHQVVMNLISNAVQAMPQGGVLRVALETATFGAPRQFAVGAIAAGDYILLRVNDTGTGIADDVLERMFDPFFTTKDVGVGSGLGLSLVHGIVTSVDGAIEVATALGKGTTFTVYLRRCGDAPERPADEDRPAPRGLGERVLVVDDEELLMRLATETLEELGYAPVGFTSSTAALEAFRADPARFDALLTDERMPGLSGSALIREVRGVRDAIPVVLMSGYLGIENVDADVVIRKPLSRHDLATSVARALGR